MFPGEIPGRSRLALLGRRRGLDHVFRKGWRRFVTNVNHFCNGETMLRIGVILAALFSLTIAISACGNESPQQAATAVATPLPTVTAPLTPARLPRRPHRCRQQCHRRRRLPRRPH